MIKIATETNAAHINVAISIANKTDLWLELGGSTAWADESNPDKESKNTTSLNGDLLYIGSPSISLVYDGGATTTTADTSTTYVYAGHIWNISSVANAYTNNANYVMLSVTVPASSITSDITYRQIGVLEGVAVKSGTTGSVILPTNIQSKGNLLFYENQKAQTYASTNTLNIKYLIAC